MFALNYYPSFELPSNFKFSHSWLVFFCVSTFIRKEHDFMAEGLRPRRAWLKGLQSPEDTRMTLNHRDMWVPPGVRSELGLSNYVPVDWRVSGPSCKPTPSVWKEGPLGVCWLTGKVLTLGGRRGKPEQAVPGNPQTPSLFFRNPILL